MTNNTPDFEAIFHAALEISSPLEREQFLQAQCGSDADLLSELQDMLTSHQNLGSFLDKPPEEVQATIIGQSEEDLAASMEAGLAPTFGQDHAVIIGDGNHSVLMSLGQSINVPRVALRESEAEGPDPIARPSSPEVPKSDSDSRYQWHGEIARGGMGAIIKGRDTDLGRDLAIKVLLDLHKDNPEVIQRFVEEAQIGGQLQHPGIAPIYELGQFSDKRPFFAMKLVKGQTLSKLLMEREDSAAERGRFLGIFEQVCQTMAYAHSRGVIHRDLKPANIMVGAFGEVQVMDWGLAKVLQAGGIADERTSRTKHKDVSIIQTTRSVGSDTPGAFGSVGSPTQMGSVMGTPAYMPPEQALGEIDHMDERADVFGLGAILCEILTGKPPYVDDDGTQVFRMASRGKLVDCFQRLEECGADDDLIGLTKICLELEPTDRPRDAGVLAERVTEYLESVETRLREAEMERAAEAARADAEAAQAVAERQRAEAESQRAAAQSAKAQAESARANEERKRRHTSLALAASVLLLVGLGGAGWLYMERQEAHRQTAEANAQRKFAADMQTLANQRDEQRKAAELARNVAEAAQQRADAEKINTLNMLADMQTERGLLAAREGQSATAALWFANAAALTPHDLDRQGANHLRASSWLNEVIAPAALLKLPDGHARRFEFQPNGPLLLTVSGFTLRIWDWRNEVVLPWSEALAEVKDAVWSPDGQQLAVGFGTSDVRIFDPVSGDELKQFRHSERVKVLEWSPDGTRLAVGGLHVQLWNVSDQPMQESSWPHPQAVFALSFNRAGTRLVTSCEDEFARVFAVGDASLPAPLYAPVEHVPSRAVPQASAVFFDEDRSLVTVGRNPYQALLHDATTGQPVTLGWPTSFHFLRYGFSVSPDSRWVAAAGYRSGYLLAADGRSFELKHNNHVRSVRFHPDGQALVTTCWDGTARWWPLQDMASATPTVGSPITIPQIRTHAQCNFSPDGSSLAIMTNQQVRIWQRPQSQSIVGVVGQVAWTDRYWRPRPSFDGQFVTPATWHGAWTRLKPRGNTLQVARMTDGQLAGAPITLNGLLWDSCVCADNRSVAAATVNGSTGILSIYDIASGAPVIPSLTLPDLPGSVAARPGHPQVAVLCQNGSLCVIDTQRGQTLLDLSHHLLDSKFRTLQVAYSPDGATLLTVTAGGVVVRDAQTGELRFPPLPRMLNEGRYQAIAFSPDSHLLVTAVTHRNMAQVWDLTTGEKVGREMPHAGDDYGLFSVAFSPDGQRILTGHKDGRARIWDWKTGTIVGAPMKHPDEVYDAQFTPDGRHVVTAVRHTSPWMWDVATTKPAVHLPQIIPAGVSSNSLAIAGDRVVVSAEHRYPVLDLSILLQKQKEELPTLLTRAELATNQKLQLGELVPLEQQEWTSRWEQLVTTRQTPEEMAWSLAGKFDEAQSESARLAVAMHAIRFNLTERLQRLRPDDPHLQVALALEFSRTGRQSELNRILAKAMADGLETLRNPPADNSLHRGLTHLAPLLADQLLAEAEKGTRWTVLKPVEMKSEGGATLTLQDDGSILASGENPDQDAYAISAKVTPQHINAIRLEAIPNSSLPRNGPGRYPGNGNFHLNEFRVLINGIPHPPDSIVVSYGEGPFDYRKIIDGIIDENNWSINPRQGQSHSAVLATDLELAAGDTLTLELVSSRWKYPRHNLGRFRLSVSDDPNAYANCEMRFTVMKLNNPWAKLAAVYHLIGDHPVLDKLLERHPQAAAGIGELYAMDENWQQAIELYSKCISDQTTDAKLLSKRAAAYIATEQWDLARADWLRGIEQQPNLLQQAFNVFQTTEQWSTAAEFGQQLLEQKPDDSIRWLKLATVMVLSGNDTAYAEFCRWVAKQPAETAELADRAIKSSLLLAKGFDLAALPSVTLTDALESGNHPEGFPPWGWASRALLAYRNGDAESAVKYVAKSEENKPKEFAHAMNLAVLALAQHELGHTDEARTTLAEIAQLMPRFKEDPKLNDYHDLLIAEILFREADGKINGTLKPDAAGKSEAVPPQND